MLLLVVVGEVEVVDGVAVIHLHVPGRFPFVVLFTRLEPLTSQASNGAKIDVSSAELIFRADCTVELPSKVEKGPLPPPYLLLSSPSILVHPHIPLEMTYVPILLQ